MCSGNLESLRKYFRAGTAEGDDSFIEDAFVPFDDYIDIISVPLGNPRLLLGNKGSGKSALLRYFKSQMEEIEIPTILLRPKDIKLSNSVDSSLGALTRDCESAILKAVASKIGSNIKGLVLNSDDKKLLKVAQSNGDSEQDSIEKLFHILSPLGKSITGVDFSKMKLGASEVGLKAIKTAVESNLQRSSKSFYVLVDDTDQIASPNMSDHLNRIWSFFLAARSIMEEAKNIKFIITLRDEVWRRLKRDNAGQRDQVDHFRNLAVKINLSKSIIETIIKKRLELSHKDLGKQPQLGLYNLFFDTNHVRIPSSYDELRYWGDFIVKRSRERPRDSIQLIFRLSEEATRKKRDKILAEDAETVMPLYSEERVDDLKRECDLECPQIKEIIREFSKLDYDEGSFTLHPNSAADFLKKIPSRMSVSLFGKQLRGDSNDSVFELWKFLHEIGFLNARVSDKRERKGYRHITIEDDPELVSVARWNDMQSMTWEVHPAYRDYLIKLHKENSFNFGLPSKKHKRR